MRMIKAVLVWCAVVAMGFCYLVEQATAGQLTVDLYSYSVYSDEPANRVGKILSIPIPDSLRGKEIDRAFVELYPSATSAADGAVQLACYGITPSRVGSEPGFVADDPVIDESALDVSVLRTASEVADSEGWRIDVTSLLADRLDSSVTEFHVLILGLSDPQVAFSLAPGTGSLALGSIARLVVYFTNSETVPIRE